MTRPVGIILQHPGAPCAQGAVSGQLIGSGGQPVVVHADPQALGKDLFRLAHQLFVGRSSGHAHAAVDADLQAALFVQLLPCLQRLRIGGRIVDRSESGFQETFLRVEHDLLQLFFRIGGDGFVEWLLRLIRNDAQQCAVRASQEFTAYGVSHVFCDPGSLERLAIAPGHVMAGALQIDRNVRRYGIQLPAVRESSILPPVVEPAGPGDPFSGSRFLCRVLYHPEDLFFRLPGKV